uniref:Putative secreted protein n=1 Tax=Anopheles darlingi TaxID=43151 RepID=A0A2M4DIJ5_ANODA
MFLKQFVFIRDFFGFSVSLSLSSSFPLGPFTDKLTTAAVSIVPHAQTHYLQCPRFLLSGSIMLRVIFSIRHHS